MKSIFCEYHVGTKENSKGTDCDAHMAEARCFKCPYTIEELKYTEEKGLYISLEEDGTDGICRSFEPKKGMERELREIAKKNMVD